MKIEKEVVKEIEKEAKKYIERGIPITCGVWGWNATKKEKLVAFSTVSYCIESGYTPLNMEELAKNSPVIRKLLEEQEKLIDMI